jgi:hypothetical protein
VPEKHPEVFTGLFGRNRNHRHLQAFTDCLCDILQRHAFFLNCVIRRYARPLIHTAFVAAVKNAIASGDLRSDTDPIDFVRALVDIFHTTALPGWEPGARRLLDILITGLRLMPTHPPRPSRNRKK